MQQLQSVKLIPGKSGVIARSNEQLFQVLAALPHLHSLTLRLSPNADGFAALATAPSLTRLNVDDTYRSAAKSRLPSIATFPHLLHLSVLRPSLYGASWAQFCSTSLAARLESLELNQMALPRNREELAARDYSAIRNMTALRELRLRRIEDVGSILSHLAALSNLQLLLLEVHASGASGRALASVPSPALASMLESSSSADLRCVFRICQLPDDVVRFNDPESLAWLRMQMEAWAERFREEVNNARLSIEIIQLRGDEDE